MAGEVHVNILAAILNEWRKFAEVYIKRNFNMGAGQSAEIPGGGSEGYHVLRVIYVLCNLHA